MGKCKWIVVFNTVLLFLHAGIASTQAWPAFNMLVFLISPFLVIYMVWKVLRDTSDPVTATFSEQFYQDANFVPAPERSLHSSLDRS